MAHETQYVLRLPNDLAAKVTAAMDEEEEMAIAIYAESAPARGWAAAKRQPFSYPFCARSAHQVPRSHRGKGVPRNIVFVRGRAWGRWSRAAAHGVRAGNLPTVVESWKTSDRKTYYKSGDVGQVRRNG